MGDCIAKFSTEQVIISLELPVTGGAFKLLYRTIDGERFVSWFTDETEGLREFYKAVKMHCVSELAQLPLTRVNP